MSLVLATATGSITRFPGGTIMVRCADFLGPARGTLAVFSDPDSVCGDVVHESQQVPYDTSAGFGPPYPADYEFVDMSAADLTLSIPFASLGFQREISYVAFVGVKVTGAGDMLHRAGEEFMELSDQNTRLRGYNDTIDEANYPPISTSLPRPETNTGYRLKWFQSVEWDPGNELHFIDRNLVPSSVTDLVVAAASGEDSTYEFYLDAIYFIPIASDADPGGNYFQQPADLTAWDPLEDVWAGDPRPNRDTDDNEVTNALNILTSEDAGYSVIYAEPAGFGTNWLAPGGDYQRANSEATAVDVANFGLWSGPTPDWPDDPSSWIALTTGVIWIPPQTVEAETFGTDFPDPLANPWTFLSTSGNYYWLVATEAAADVEVVGGVLDFSNIGGTGFNALRAATLGASDSPLPVPGSPTHADLRQDAHDLSCGIVEAQAAIVQNVDAGEMAAWVGWGFQSGLDTDVIATGVALYLDSGNLMATLRGMRVYDPQFGSTVDNAADFGTSPVTVETGYSLGDFVNVKVERRYYVWRAKVWMVGDSEPGSWTLEGLAPHFYPDAVVFPSVLNVSQYPYSDTNLDEWGNEVRSYDGSMPMIGAVTAPDTAIATTPGQIQFNSCTVSYDPDGTRAGAHMALEKYDGTVQYGSVDFDTDRVAIASLQPHTFNDDADGFNIRLWADGGAAGLQSTTVTDVIMRAPLGAIFGSIKYP